MRGKTTVRLLYVDCLLVFSERGGRVGESEKREGDWKKRGRMVSAGAGWLNVSQSFESAIQCCLICQTKYVTIFFSNKTKNEILICQVKFIKTTTDGLQFIQFNEKNNDWVCLSAFVCQIQKSEIKFDIQKYNLKVFDKSYYQKMKTTTINKRLKI